MYWHDNSSILSQSLKIEFPKFLHAIFPSVFHITNQRSYKKISLFNVYADVYVTRARERRAVSGWRVWMEQKLLPPRHSPCYTHWYIRSPPGPTSHTRILTSSISPPSLSLSLSLSLSYIYSYSYISIIVQSFINYFCQPFTFSKQFQTTLYISILSFQCNL